MTVPAAVSLTSTKAYINAIWSQPPGGKTKLQLPARSALHVEWSRDPRADGKSVLCICTSLTRSGQAECVFCTYALLGGSAA
ncbi:Hypothetical predicted protein [Cloeon dipterum]|uniref:Uncharacterized protein n=1 Tax=Cloeon dipterum TaxID=197152 RepID=A0A8S1BVB4_9INSE|nr:Hypothetical predicted protein [Cloeon dipterum]